MEETTKTGLVSSKKLPIVQSASFATLVEAIISKSAKAQRTFLLQLSKQLGDEELTSMNVISQKEIKLRGKNQISIPTRHAETVELPADGGRGVVGDVEYGN